MLLGSTMRDGPRDVRLSRPVGGEYHQNEQTHGYWMECMRGQSMRPVTLVSRASHKTCDAIHIPFNFVNGATDHWALAMHIIIAPPYPHSTVSHLLSMVSSTMNQFQSVGFFSLCRCIDWLAHQTMCHEKCSVTQRVILQKSSPCVHLMRYGAVCICCIYHSLNVIEIVYHASSRRLPAATANCNDILRWLFSIKIGKRQKYQRGHYTSFWHRKPQNNMGPLGLAFCKIKEMTSKLVFPESIYCNTF